MTRKELEKAIESIFRDLELIKNGFENLEDEVEDDDLYDAVVTARENVDDTICEVGKLQSILENGEFAEFGE